MRLSAGTISVLLHRQKAESYYEHPHDKAQKAIPALAVATVAGTSPSRLIESITSAYLQREHPWAEHAETNPYVLDFIVF